MIEKAVLLAGGQGLRLRPLTLTTPKPLVQFQNKTLIETVMDKISQAGVKDFVLTIGYLKKKIKEYLKENKHISFIEENSPLGTGGFLNMIGKSSLPDLFIVANADNLFDLNWENMIMMHKNNNALITIALTEIEDVSNSGVVSLKGDRINNFVEKPNKEDAKSNLISSGYYIFSKKVLDHLPNKEKISLEKDFFPAIADMNKLFGYKDSGKWFDTGTKEKLENAQKNWKIKAD